MNIQTFLVIGSLVALTYTILNINNKTGIETNMQLNYEAVISGTSIGQSLLEEIAVKSFDERTISKRMTSKDSLTINSLLGKDAGEVSVKDFDDLDDYNGYIKRDTLSRLGIFSCNITVYYVVTLSPGTKSTSRTFSKKIDVIVSNKYLADNLFFTKIASY